MKKNKLIELAFEIEKLKIRDIESGSEWQPNPFNDYITDKEIELEKL